VKVAVVVPYSWSFLGGVVEHATNQCAALEELGVETRLLIGYDPPDLLTRLTHPGDDPRTEAPPPNVYPISRSVIVIGNQSRPKLMVSRRAMWAPRKALRGIDVIHVHEPLTPIPAAGSLAWGQAPTVATFHAAGASSWRGAAMFLWGFLLQRIDYRIAVSETARSSAREYLPGDYEIIPNGVALPTHALPTERENTVVFVGRADPRKGLQHLLRAWPAIRARTGARLHVIGLPPREVRTLLLRQDVPEEGIDMLGTLYDDDLTRELSEAKLLVAPSEGSESFGMVLTRAFSCGTPVVASDIPGYRAIVTPQTGFLFPPKDVDALIDNVVGALADEPRRRELGAAAREVAESRYSWGAIAPRLLRIYERVGAASN